MAEQRRDYIWLECTECGARNYRTERRMKQDASKTKKKISCMDAQNRLQLMKFCIKDRKHTIHRETRKK